MMQDMEFAVLDFIQNYLHCGFLDFLMPKISLLGNGGMLWIAISLCLLANKRYRKGGIILLAGLLIGALTVNVILKPLIARPRPCWIKNTDMLIAIPRDYSFPSGHTMSSFTAAFILRYINKYFGYAAIPAAGLIAFSRLYLYVHYPSDILGGIILGMITAKLVYMCGISAIEKSS